MLDKQRALIFLVSDEIEAIQGYDDVIESFKDDEEFVKVLQEIKEEEKKHIEKLKKFVGGDVDGK